jgi:catechol 2,3-dioxygenase-like lactoylglutathione lyase family enzyme
MITGAHVLLYSKDPETDRAFFRDVLGFRAVDAGGGWLIFALPPAEIAVHPSNGDFAQLHAGQALSGCVLYLMCDDLSSFVDQLAARHVACAKVQHEDWGLATTIRLPSGGAIGLYQPEHPTAIGRVST